MLMYKKNKLIKSLFLKLNRHPETGSVHVLFQVLKGD